MKAGRVDDIVSGTNQSFSSSQRQQTRWDSYLATEKSRRNRWEPQRLREAKTGYSSRVNFQK